MSTPRTSRVRGPAVPLARWVEARGGVVHRHAALEAGYPAARIRAEVGVGAIRRIRRFWLAAPGAAPDLVLAAASSGMLACTSAAARRGWWEPESGPHDPRPHIVLRPHAAVPTTEVAIHWSRPLVEQLRFSLVESVEDSLQHLAECLPYEEARTVWESAARVERLSRDYLVGVAWTRPAARVLAADTTGLSDSGIESVFVGRFRGRGLRIRQQVRIAGRHVDILLGERLVVQADGFAFHSSAADRGRDIAHDAELAARGYTVLRFSYAQILHDWPAVDRAVTRAVARGLHLAR